MSSLSTVAMMVMQVTPTPRHTARLPTYLWHTAAALHLFIALLTGKVTIVHTPVLQQRVVDSAK